MFDELVYRVTINQQELDVWREEATRWARTKGLEVPDFARVGGSGELDELRQWFGSLLEGDESHQKKKARPSTRRVRVDKQSDNRLDK